jgi:glycine/D-amino acid oxidase-like deaminating enzyme
MAASESFWLADHPRPRVLIADSAPTHVDVAVVGGGLTGLNAARILARSGTGVVVFEAGQVGRGASGRNGGFCTVGTTLGLGTMRKRYGEAVARQFWTIARDAVDVVAETLAEEAIDCDFRQSGRIRLAMEPRHSRRLMYDGHVLGQLGYRCTFLPTEELRQVIGYGRFHGGLLDEGSACLHPAKLLFGLALAARRRGVSLVESTPVHSIRRDGVSSFLLAHANGVTRAKAVIIATDGYTDGLVPALQRRVIPVGSYIIVTDRLSDDERAKFNPGGRIFATTLHFMNYFRLTPDGRILFGGRNDLRADQETVQSQRELKARFDSFFPELRHRAVEFSWGGRLGFTFDQMPHMGAIDGIHYALGYCGHGVPMSIWCGRAVAGLITGQSAGLPFERMSYPSMPFYRGNPWFLPVVASWYRLKDRLA